jgi:hypothetical protein
MLGGKRGQLHSEVHPSFFSSLGISIPPNWELFGTRVWPVLVRQKNSQKETLVHSKNQTQPSLPLSIKIMGPADAKRSHDTAWVDFIQRLEVELEEKVLRYKLTLKDRPQLEWSWQEETSRGGTECTILAHIDTGSRALSIQNKRHLHWKALDSTQGMNNEVEFSAPAHNLLMKTEAENTARQENKNCSANIQASPQAARKKRYTKLNIMTLISSRVDNDTLTSSDRETDDGDQEHLTRDAIRAPGSIGPPAARNRLTYV